MEFLAFPNINIINIYSYEKDIEKFYRFPVYYRRSDSTFDYRNDHSNPKLNITIYNLTFEEFFNIDTNFYMLNEEVNNTIFLFETEE